MDTKRLWHTLIVCRHAVRIVPVISSPIHQSSTAGCPGGDDGPLEGLRYAPPFVRATVIPGVDPMGSVLRWNGGVMSWGGRGTQHNVQRRLNAFLMIAWMFRKAWSLRPRLIHSDTDIRN